VCRAWSVVLHAVDWYRPVSREPMPLVQVESVIDQFRVAISGVAYQQETLAGTRSGNIWWKSSTAPAAFAPFVSRLSTWARGRSKRVSNLTMTCASCNAKEGRKGRSRTSLPAKPRCSPLKDAVNAARWAWYGLWRTLVCRSRVRPAAIPRAAARAGAYGTGFPTQLLHAYPSAPRCPTARSPKSTSGELPFVRGSGQCRRNQRHGCKLLHRADGYGYAWRPVLPPPAEPGGLERGRLG
jgi:hypothetical protein